MVFSVRPSTKLSKIKRHRGRLELAVSGFKLIFNGHHIMEDETVSLLIMEDGSTINVVFNRISFGPLMELAKKGKEVRLKTQTKQQLVQQQHGSNHCTSDPRFVGQNLLDLNGNRNFERDVEKENQETNPIMYKGVTTKQLKLDSLLQEIVDTTEYKDG